MIDFEKIRQDHPTDRIMARYGVELKAPNGQERTTCCPFHDEKTPSMVLYPDGHYHCYGCGAHGGDAVDFVAAVEGVETRDALRMIVGDDIPKRNGAPTNAPKQKGTRYPDCIPTANQPAYQGKRGDTIQLYMPKTGNVVPVQPDAVYHYFERTGEPHGCVLRMKKSDGRKTFRPMRWCAWPDSEGWAAVALDRPQPLFWPMPTKGEGQVWIVEGEKAAMALSRVVPSNVEVCTWPGGGDNVAHADWFQLEGRSVFIWPDGDKAGTKCGRKLREILLPIAGKVKAIDCTEGMPVAGWDAFDAIADGWGWPEIVAWAKPRVKLYEAKAPAPVREPAPAETPSTSGDADPSVEEHSGDDSDRIQQTREAAGVAGSPSSAQELDEVSRRPRPAHELVTRFSGNPYFRILGHDEEIRLYYVYERGQVIQLSPRAHSDKSLMDMAPMAWWTDTFPEAKGKAQVVDAAADALFRFSSKVGPTYLKVRGRGVWEDDGRLVVHLGTKLYVDGRETRPQDLKSQHVYSRTEDCGLEHTAHEMGLDGCQEFLELCTALQWERSLNGYLLAGWLVTSLIGGCLEWRPHIWISGESGAGKSTIIDELCRPFLGAAGLCLTQGSSVAGIRNLVQRDSLPVILDEQEGEQQKAREIVEEILAMVRAASSGGVVAKGNAEGGARQYLIRSCYLFSSINPRLANQADRNRIANLVLRVDRRDDAEPRYREWRQRAHNLLDDEWPGRMFSRVTAKIQTYHRNSETLRVALRDRLGSARDAQQYAPLLAGALLLMTDEEYNLEMAHRWLGGLDWGDQEHGIGNDMRDPDRLLSIMLQQRHQFEADGHRRDFSLYELVSAAANRFEGLKREHAEFQLGQLGFKVYDKALDPDKWCAIETQNTWLGRRLRESPWASDAWGPMLLSLDGVERFPNPVRICGQRRRAIKVPLEYLLGERDVQDLAMEGGDQDPFEVSEDPPMF